MVKCLCALRAQVLSEFGECLSALQLCVHALCLAKCLIRYYWNKIVSIRRCFIYIKRQNSREDFEEINFEGESERFYHCVSFKIPYRITPTAISILELPLHSGKPPATLSVCSSPSSASSPLSPSTHQFSKIPS